MNVNEIEIYDTTLNLYTLIISKKIEDKELAIRCLRVFEYFDDYEKCKDLMEIIKKMP